jgi:hypothetical protein
VAAVTGTTTPVGLATTAGAPAGVVVLVVVVATGCGGTVVDVEVELVEATVVLVVGAARSGPDLVDAHAAVTASETKGTNTNESRRTPPA